MLEEPEVPEELRVPLRDGRVEDRVAPAYVALVPGAADEVRVDNRDVRPETLHVLEVEERRDRRDPLGGQEESVRTDPRHQVPREGRRDPVPALVARAPPEDEGHAGDHERGGDREGGGAPGRPRREEPPRGEPNRLADQEDQREDAREDEGGTVVRGAVGEEDEEVPDGEKEAERGESPVAQERGHEPRKDGQEAGKAELQGQEREVAGEGLREGLLEQEDLEPLRRDVPPEGGRARGVAPVEERLAQRAKREPEVGEEAGDEAERGEPPRLQQVPERGLRLPGGARVAVAREPGLQDGRVPPEDQDADRRSAGQGRSRAR